MISDVDLMVNKYVSVPKDMGGLNCAAFVAGIVKGSLDNAGFPARLRTYSPPLLPSRCLLPRFECTCSIHTSGSHPFAMML